MPVAGSQSLDRKWQGESNGQRFQRARQLGIDDLAGMCAVVMTLTSADFLKSMTTHVDHRIWQDVYHATTSNRADMYLKLTVIDDVLIVSFKDL